MEEEWLSIAESYENTVRKAILKGLKAMGCSIKDAAHRLEQEPSNTSLRYPEAYTMYWLKAKLPTEKKRPICLVSQATGQATGDGEKGRKVKAYYGLWAQYIFTPMQADAFYSFSKPYEL